MSGKRLLLAAGGTGGHIFPAVAFGRWMSENHGADVSYLCGSREVEQSIYSAIGITPHVLQIGGSPLGAAGVMQKLKRIKALISSHKEASRIIEDIEPDACISFGGYASAPMLSAAKLRGIKTVAHEQNASAGVATKIASMAGIPIASGWRACTGVKAYTFTGVPVRRMDRITRGEAWRALGLPGDAPSSPVVVAMTGSLGSEGLSSTLRRSAIEGKLKGITLLLVDPGQKTANTQSDGLHLLPQMWDPSPLFSAADIVITRCGASTLSEVAAFDIPCIAVPWRKAARDHQMSNAIEFCRSPRRCIWDEDHDDEYDLASKLHSLAEDLNDADKANGQKLYYNNEEVVCKRLMSMLEL